MSDGSAVRSTLPFRKAGNGSVRLYVNEASRNIRNDFFSSKDVTSIVCFSNVFLDLSDQPRSILTFCSSDEIVHLLCDAMWDNDGQCTRAHIQQHYHQSIILLFQTQGPYSTKH